MFVSAGMEPYQANRRATQIVGNDENIGLMDVAPGTWWMKMMDKAGQEVGRGDYGAAAAHTTVGAFGPFGRPIARGLGAAARNVAPGMFAGEAPLRVRDVLNFKGLPETNRLQAARGPSPASRSPAAPGAPIRRSDMPPGGLEPASNRLLSAMGPRATAASLRPGGLSPARRDMRINQLAWESDARARAARDGISQGEAVRRMEAEAEGGGPKGQAMARPKKPLGERTNALQNAIAKRARELSPEAEVVKALKGLKRVRTTGQYVGAPPGVNTPTKLKKMIKKYQTAMIAGKDQREWYTTSGRSIFSHAGDDPVLANKLTEAFATTSANTGVVANTGHAVKGHNQAVLNQAVNTGQLPGTMGPTIEDVYRAGGSTTGMKRTPFGENLALGGEFRTVPNPRPVHDVWDVRAHGYGDNWKGSVSPPQHEFLDTVDNAIIDQANTRGLGGVKDWNPLRSQAAAWRGQQNELALAKGKPVPQGMYDFSENLPRHAAQGSREAIPGATTGHMPELQSAPRAVQESYDDEVANIMYDAQGRDFIAMGNQALAGGHIKGPGIFNQASTVPGRQTMTPVGSNAVDVTIPSTGKTIATREVDPASRALMDANEAQYAFHTGQDAAAWSKTYPSPKPGRDSFELELPGGTITHDQAILMMEQAGINPEGIAVVPTPQGVRLVNLIGEQSDAFDDIAKQAAQALGVKRPAGEPWVYGKRVEQAEKPARAGLRAAIRSEEHPGTR